MAMSPFLSTNATNNDLISLKLDIFFKISQLNSKCTFSQFYIFIFLHFYISD